MYHSQGFISLKSPKMTLKEKIWQISWSYFFFITAVACIGFLMLYSAANGNLKPWASAQALRFGVGLAGALIISLIDIRYWMRYAYLLYALSLALLVAVEVKGIIGMGAQRWINLGFFYLQPSELTKITLVLALARFFHGTSLQEVESNTHMITPVLLTIIPAVFVLKQPDLGTALMLMMAGGFLFFIVGVQMWKFGVLGGLGLISIPIAWQFLHEYQKQRVYTFLNPERDPLGAGYHIIQSKITMGSGGVFGKGFMKGTQSHLNFLPEKQTDFIFTMMGEELGLIGCVGLLILYIIIIAYGYSIAVKSQNYFGKLLAVGLTINFFLYVFINIAMVMGLIPVVGVPLPLISYGGTVMLTIMTSFGLIQSVNVHKDIQIGRRGASIDDF